MQLSTLDSYQDPVTPSGFNHREYQSLTHPADGMVICDKLITDNLTPQGLKNGSRKQLESVVDEVISI